MLGSSIYEDGIFFEDLIKKLNSCPQQIIWEFQEKKIALCILQKKNLDLVM